MNADGTQIAVSQASEGLVEFWHIIDEPKIVRRIETEQNVFAMDWDSAREIFVIAGNRGGLYYWRDDLDTDPDSGQPIATFGTVNESRILGFDFSPDANIVAMACYDNLQLLDIRKVRIELKKPGLDW